MFTLKLDEGNCNCHLNVNFVDVIEIECIGRILVTCQVYDSELSVLTVLSILEYCQSQSC
jgi:hypothetical protein